MFFIGIIRLFQLRIMDDFSIDELISATTGISLEDNREFVGTILDEIIDGCWTLVHPSITFEEMLGSIEECEYLKNVVSNQKKDFNSLSYLIKDLALSQSDCIKLGTGIEKLLKEIVLKTTDLVDIRPKNKKGEKEKDHLFEDKRRKIIYYAELKSNLNLDTEKSANTAQKVKTIETELIKKYPNHQISVSLLGLRYFTLDICSPLIKKKYTLVQNNLVGVNEYFQKLGVNFQFTQDQYGIFINNTAKFMIKSP